MKKVFLKVIGFFLDKLIQIHCRYKTMIARKSLGESVTLVYPYNIKGIDNFHFGNNVYIAANSLIFSTRARLLIGDNVTLGPNVSIITGDHEYKVGLFMNQITDSMKSKGSDLDVIIGNDVWIGANSTILKGVEIGEGVIIAAGSVVTSNLESYCIYGGVPAQKIRQKWTDDEIRKHKALINR